MERPRRQQQQQQQQQSVAATMTAGAAATHAATAPAAALKEAHDELRYLRSDCKLKDDTIKFLQREKEVLQREVQHYEKLCAGVESEVLVNAQSEAENARLRDELDRAKDALRRQRLQIRALSSSSSSGGGGHYDEDDRDEAAAAAAAAGALGTSVCGRLLALLRGSTTPASRKLQQRLANETHRYAHVAASRPELCLEMLSLVDRSLAELCECAAARRQQQQRQGSGGSAQLVALATADLTRDGSGRPVLRYAYSAAPGTSYDSTQTAYGRLSSEEVMLARRQHQREATARSAVTAAARATTAPSGHGPAFVGLDRGTVLPGLKPVSAMAASGGRR